MTEDLGKIPQQKPSGEMPALSDEELVSSIKAGDRQSYPLLVKRFLPKIWRLSLSILHNEQEAEDATQEIFLSLWQNIEKWDPQGTAKFSTWIYRVSFNKCIDIKRARKNTVSEDSLPEKSTSSDAYDDMLQTEVSKKMIELLSELPKAQQAVMRLFYYEELSVEEITQKLKTTDQSVRSLLKRGRKSIKEKMKFDPDLNSWEFPDVPEKPSR